MSFGEQSRSRPGQGKRRKDLTPAEKADKAARREAKRVSAWPARPENGQDPEPLTPDQDKALYERSLNLCVWHLGRSAKTRAELARKLADKNVPTELAERVLARLVEIGYLDDASYAESYVRSRHEGQHKGAQAIRFELRRKGVDDETAAAALEAVTPETEAVHAAEIAARKARSSRGKDRNKRVQLVAAALARKGYGGSVAFSAARQAVDDDEAACADPDGP